MVKKPAISWQEATSYINEEIFRNNNGKLFTVEDLYDGICKRLDIEGRAPNSGLKQQILGNVTTFIFARVLCKDEDGRYRIRTEYEK